jgi:serine/threonine protein kinase
MTDKRLFAIGKGIANGMSFLHKHSVCHRDLQSHTVLYDTQLNIKVRQSPGSWPRRWANCSLF